MSIIEQGQLKGSFKGFKNRDTTFQFYGGGTWIQATYLYHYHYAYMPKAKVTNEGGLFYLEVEGINEILEVKRG